MVQEESFGVIPLRKAAQDWHVFLIQHKHSSYWGFPKGHAEPKELPKTAAYRELKEETNLDILRFLQEDPLVEQYRFFLGGRRVHKQVSYFIAEVCGEVILQKEEIADGIWLPLKEAYEKLTHAESKALLKQVEHFLALFRN